MPPNPGAPSGTWNWQPALPEFLLEAFDRIQIRAPELTTDHLISARRSANFILQDYANRGVNLWDVDTLAVALQPGVPGYALPQNTVDLLGCVVRTYTAGAPLANIGSTMTAIVGAANAPVLASPYGEVTTTIASFLFSTVAGSPFVNFRWPNHGLAVGMPVFFTSAMSVAGMALPQFNVVTAVPDANTVTFLAPQAAPATRIGQGATALFATTAASATVQVYLPGHGLQLGSSFAIGVAVTVGGITLPSGAYPVTSVTPNSASYPSYLFTITAPEAALSSDVAFENGGAAQVATQQSSVEATDILLWPISRDDYAMIPLKQDAGRPTTFWYDRTLVPSIQVWQVPPPNVSYGFIAYRTREPQDAVAGNGVGLEFPRRIYAAFVAELTASLAEKFRPEQFAAKAQIAVALWNRASDEDREKVSTHIQPDLSGYWNS